MVAQRALSAQIVAAVGDYIWTVKRNQRELYDDIQWLFAPLRPDEQASDFDFRQASSVDKGHGRLEERTLRVSSLLKGYSTWPGLEQVFELTSRVTDGQGRVITSVRYGVTRLSARTASPGQLLRWVREHWQQENSLHYVKDVTLGEDRSLVHAGHGPAAMSLLRDAMRWSAWCIAVAPPRWRLGCATMPGSPPPRWPCLVSARPRMHKPWIRPTLT